MDFADVIAQAALPETSVALCLRRDLNSQWRDLERKLQTANTETASIAERSEKSIVAEQMEALRKEMAIHEVTFRLRALPALEWNRFEASLPQRNKEETAEDFLTTRFYPRVAELLSRCSVDPAMTPDQVNQLVDVISGGDWNALSTAVWALNDQREGVPFSAAAYAAIQSNDGS